MYTIHIAISYLKVIILHTRTEYQQRIRKVYYIHKIFKSLTEMSVNREHLLIFAAISSNRNI